MIRKDITEKELYERTISLVREHLDDINPDILNFIMMNWNDKIAVDVLLEAYDEMDVLAEETNVYSGFLEAMKSQFDINQDIIEVGAGIFPCLARRIVKEQTIGRVTVYDPNLVLQDYNLEGLILRKEMFREDTPVGKAKLLVGMSPCHSMDLILKRAGEEGLDFMIKVCQCELAYSSDDSLVIKTMFDEYLNEKNNFYKKYGRGNFEVTYLEEKYQDPSPIVYSKKRM